jgi:hypothetical protein
MSGTVSAENFARALAEFHQVLRGNRLETLPETEPLLRQHDTAGDDRLRVAGRPGFRRRVGRQEDQGPPGAAAAHTSEEDIS